MKKLRKYYSILFTLLCVLSIQFIPLTVFASTSTSTTTAQRNAIANDWSYYAAGVYENNCLAYAMGNTTSWIWPWGSSNPTVATTQTWLTSQGYSSVYGAGPLPSTLKMTAYELNGAITHFARAITSSTCRAKWGHCEIFNHSSLDPYTDAVYGSLALRIY